MERIDKGIKSHAYHWMIEKENVLHIHYGIRLSHKEELNLVFQKKIKASGNHYV